MLELLGISVLFFAGGYGYRIYDEPTKVCKTIKLDVPQVYTEGIDIKDCKQDNSKTTCPIEYPRFVLSEKEYMKDINNGKGTRTHLNNCINMVELYNKDKFEMVD